MAEKKLANSVAEHKKHAEISVCVAIITLSTSRAQKTDLSPDKSGDIIQQLLEDHGHKVIVRKLLPDNRALLRAAIRQLIKNKSVQAIITTGGTGLTPTDVTIEAIKDMLDKELPGFNALFMYLSYSQVKSAAMLSRALAGTIKGRILFCLPGSPRACQLATESLIVPELGHILHMLSGK
jgi:molybdopterin adenylyltransferase